MNPQQMRTAKSPFKEKSLFLAPMEGFTDEAFRIGMEETFAGWDHYACDFLRVPSNGLYPDKKILGHYGNHIIENSELKKKTYYQILTSDNAKTEETVCKIEGLGFEWIDLNLGCPSKAVNGSKGGSFLLSDLKILKSILKKIRSNFSKTFTAKIRLGYYDTSSFEDIIQLLNDEGIEAICIHGRTKVEMYKGRANWDYIKRAVKISDVPIIGNGDIWTIEDIVKIFDYTDCHSIMMARGALKTPWIADMYKKNINNLNSLAKDTDFQLKLRKKNIPLYFNNMEKCFREIAKNDKKILLRCKSLCRYIFDDFINGEEFKKKLLRSQTYDEFQNNLRNLEHLY